MASSDDRGGSPLRRLDDAVVPRLQRTARKAVRAAAWPVRALWRWERRFAEGRPERFLWHHRQGLVLAVALIAFTGSYVHLQRYQDLGTQADDQAVAGPTSAPSTGDGPVLAGGAVIVGPTQGERLGSYITDRHEILGELPDDETRVAVVSFTEYLTPQDADATIPDGLTAVELQMRLPDQSMDPFEVEVEDGIEEAASAAIAEQRERIAEEEAEFQELIGSGTVEDEDFLAEFREQLERLKAVRNLLDTGAGTVFAVVVRGPVSELGDLAASDRVRLVDPAPAEIELEASTFYGILPDDQETASYGGIA